MHRRFKSIQQKFKVLPHPIRAIVGLLLILGGILWFLPILGLWMIPLGLLVLALDFPLARRGYLSIMLWFRKWRTLRRQSKELRLKERQQKNK